MTKERRYLLILGGLILLAGAIYRFLPADGMGLGSGPDIELSRSRLAKYKRLIAQNRSIDAQLKQAGKAANSLSQVFLDGDTTALAAVDIQNILNRIAQDTQVHIDRVDVRKPEKIKNERIIRIPVRFNIVSTIRQLQEFVYGVEASKKILRITDIKSSAMVEKKPVLIKTSITLEGVILEE